MAKSRLKRLQKALKENKLDALLVRVNEGDNQNVLYLSGFGGTTAVAPYGVPPLNITPSA